MVKLNVPSTFGSDPIWGKKKIIDMPTMNDVIEITKTEGTARQFLIDVGVYQVPSKCGACGMPVKQMSSNPNDPDFMKVRCCKSKKHKDGKDWKESVKKGSILDNSNLSSVKFVRFVWFWLNKVRLGAIKKFLGMGQQAVTDWNQFLSEFVEVIYTDSRRSGGKIGGPGIVVHIDESKFGKRKYNVRIYCQVFMF